MEMTNTTRRLIDRAAGQIVRELSRTPVGKVPIGDLQSGPWVSVDPQVGPEGGLKYIRAGLGRLDGDGVFVQPVPGLMDAVAKGKIEAAQLMVERVIVWSLKRRLQEVAPC